MSGVQVTGSVIGREQVIAKLQRAGSAAHQAVYKLVQELGLRLLAKVKLKLSDDVLHVRTGRLRRSINLQMTDEGDAVVASVGTNVIYARIHEFGGTTRPHVIEAKKGKALRFESNGMVYYRRRVNHPGSKMPERSFLRSSLEDMRTYIHQRLEQGVAQALREA
jgi:phage gpG-like protein